MYSVRSLVKEIVNKNCFWPVNQTFADKLLRTSKRIIRYFTLYSMAGVAMSGCMFRIPSSSMDVGLFASYVQISIGTSNPVHSLS